MQQFARVCRLPVMRVFVSLASASALSLVSCKVEICLHTKQASRHSGEFTLQASKHSSSAAAAEPAAPTPRSKRSKSAAVATPPAGPKVTAERWVSRMHPPGHPKGQEAL